MTRILGTVLSFLIFLQAMSVRTAAAQELVNLVFTSDLITNGEFNVDHWSFLSDPLDPNAVPQATIGSTGRAFQTGPAGNDEALFIVPSQGGAQKFFEGAVWQIPQNNGLTSEDAVAVPRTSVVFVETETYSDVASTWSQWYKVDVSAGIRGNGRSIEGGFQSQRNENDLSDHTGETHLTTNTNYSTDPDGDNQQKVQLQGLNLEPEFKIVNSNWNGAATAADLNQSYVNRFTFRHVFAPDSQVPLGSRVETNGAIADNATPAFTGNGEALPQLLMPELIDRITVQLLRHQGVPNDRSSFVRYDELADGATIADAQVGIRSLRLGVTGRTDFDTGFSTTDSGDGPILISNLGSGGEHPQGSKLFFDGDANADGRTTASGDGEWLLEDLDQGSLPQGSVETATYNPTTGELTVKSTGVARVTLFSTGENLMPLANSTILSDTITSDSVVDEPSSGDLTWFSTDNLIAGMFAGRVVDAGTPVSDLSLYSQLRGELAQRIQILVVPEPASVILLIALAASAWPNRRRR
ncbi:MAG: PEP-CTERM sorting domain-containing protein [Lacipirellulaceae bacterium]